MGGANRIRSGVSCANVDVYLPFADAVIVGSDFKTLGQWQNRVDYDRTAAFMERVNQLRAA